MSAENINPLTDLDLGITVRGLVPGQKVLNRFTLQRVLGRGGMGVVWLARDESLDFDVALKFLPEVLAKDQSALEELKREARRSLELSHPHIVKFYYFFQDENCAGISMEYVAGDTLANLRLTRPGKIFEVEELQPWVHQLCQALYYAHHDVKIVHRDLKPANLMLDNLGRLKITDFGIARSVAESLTRVTQHKGGVSGTLVYMSPQQAMGEQPSVADDIYAVGTTLYELLTSKPPFYSGEILAQVREKAPAPIHQRRKELGIEGKKIPLFWERTIAACLHKDPAQRPASAREIIERLNLGERPPASSIAVKPAPPIQIVSPEEPTLAAETRPQTPSKSAAAPPPTPGPSAKIKPTGARPPRGVIIEVDTELSGPLPPQRPATTPPATTQPPPKTTKKTAVPSPPPQPTPPRPVTEPALATAAPVAPPPSPLPTTPPSPPTTPPSPSTPPAPALPTVSVAESPATPRGGSGTPVPTPAQPPAPTTPPTTPPTAQPQAPPPAPPPPPPPRKPLLTPALRHSLGVMLKSAVAVLGLAALVYAAIQGWQYYQNVRHPPGHLVVEADPPDVRLELRGEKTYEPMPGGKEFRQVAPGIYALLATRAGYWPATNVLTLERHKDTAYARYQKHTLRLTPQQGTLSLQPMPADAQATVVARRTDAGLKPGALQFSATNLNPALLAGEYQVTLTRAGYRPWTTNVIISPQATVTLAPVMIRSTGQLRVDSRPGPARYILTGPEEQRLTGVCPAVLTNLPSGRWRVSLEAEQYVGFVTNVVVPEDGVANVVGLLSRLQGEVQFSVAVPQARFHLRGPMELSGFVTDEFRQTVPVGEYELVLTAPGYYARTQRLTIEAQSVAALGRLELPRITGWLRVTVEPATATLILQPNRPLSSGQLTELPVGSYTLQAELPGYDTRLEGLTVVERQTNQRVVRLTRSVGGVTFRVQPAQATNYLRYLTRDWPGNDLAQAPVNQRIDLPTGEYVLEVGLARYQPLQRRFTVSANTATNLGILVLEPLRGAVEVAFRPATARAELEAVDAPLNLKLTNQEAGVLRAPAAGLPVGEYVLRLTAAGYSNFTSRLHIQENQTTRLPPITLDRLVGTLNVSLPHPTTATVSVSGPETPLAPGEQVELQKSPTPTARILSFEQLPTGFYRLQITMPGHEPWTRRVEISSGAPVQQELPPLVRSTGALLVNTTPAEAQLLLEQIQSEAGLSKELEPRRVAAPAVFSGLPTGRYRVTAMRPRTFSLPGLGTNAWQTAVEVEVSRSQTNHTTLALPFASVTLETQPPGACLLLEGRPVRETGQPPLVLAEIGLEEKVTFLARLPNHRPTPWVLDARELGLRPQTSLTATQALQFWPGPQADDRYWTNSLGMKFVNLNRKIFLSVWECRVQDYTNLFPISRLPNLAPYEELERGKKEGEGPGLIQHAPIINVRWGDAKKFCRELQGRELGRQISSNHLYRLPTDWEWSLACNLPEEPGKTPEERSGRLGPPWYVWGREFPPRLNCGNFPQFVSFDYFERLAPVGMFPPNERGLFDLAGNVWEWCEDTADSQSSERVLRGGSWKWDVVHDLYPTAWLASFRRTAPPETMADDIGFRVVLDITDETPASPPRPPPQTTPPSKTVPVPVLAMRHSLGWRGKGWEELGKERNFKPNLTEARRQWEAAARAGEVEAQFRSWYLVDYGLVPLRRGDETAASNFLAQAAQKGLAVARIEYATKRSEELFQSGSSPLNNYALQNEIRNHCDALLSTEKGVLAARAAFLRFNLEKKLYFLKAKAFVSGELAWEPPDILKWLLVAEQLGHWKAGDKIKEYENTARRTSHARDILNQARSNAVLFLQQTAPSP